MRCSTAIRRAIAAAAITTVSLHAHAASTDILFVGNSFTHGHNEPVKSFNNASVTDENGTGMGGVPGIFKMMTMQAGLSYNVSIEAVSSQTLAGHYSGKSSIIGQAKWDTVVLQEQSTTPLPVSHGGNPNSFFTAANNLKNLIRANNASASVLLYETWASPTSVIEESYPAGTAGLQAMQNDLRDAYFKSYYDSGFSGVARVGEAFLNAVNSGVADANPSDGVAPGTINLWNTDVRHASKYGSYLSAAIFYGKVTQLDPRQLSATDANSAALALSISPTDAQALHTLAYQINAAAYPAYTVATRTPIAIATYTGSFVAGTPGQITGNASVSSITTAEGTFTNLIGATANAVTSTNVTSSLGTAPASKDASVTGLSVNDGANNLTSGNFQLGGNFDADTRFFVLESALASGTLGDDVTVTLIDDENAQVGAFSLDLRAGDFNDMAVAKLSYSSGVASLVGTASELGGVSFSLADLGVTDFSQIAGATGIRLQSTTLDPNVVGTYSVPEPSLLAFVALAGGLLTRRR